jgi:hypothetical protein
MELLGPDDFELLTRGSDAWLPSSIWIIGQDVSGNRSLLVGIPRWPSDKMFSRNASEGKERYKLSEGL